VLMGTRSSPVCTGYRQHRVRAAQGTCSTGYRRHRVQAAQGGTLLNKIQALRRTPAGTTSARQVERRGCRRIALHGRMLLATKPLLPSSCLLGELVLWQLLLWSCHLVNKFCVSSVLCVECLLCICAAWLATCSTHQLGHLQETQPTWPSNATLRSHTLLCCVCIGRGC
jgi:hypothetical protein